MPNRDPRLQCCVHCSYPVGQKSRATWHPSTRSRRPSATASWPRGGSWREHKRWRVGVLRSATKLVGNRGGGILEVLKIAKYQLLDPYGPLGTPKPPPDRSTPDFGLCGLYQVVRSIDDRLWTQRSMWAMLRCAMLRCAPDALQWAGPHTHRPRGGVLHREGGRYVSPKAFLARFFVLYYPQRVAPRP